MQKPTPTKVVILVMVAAAILAQKSLAQRTGKAAPPQAIPTIEQSQGDSLTREALAAFVKRDWELAIRGYDQLAKLSPGIADYHLNLGIAYYSSGRAHQAVQPLRQALNLKPTLTLARYYLGPSLAGSGQCKQALPYLKKDAPRVSEKHLKYEIGLAGIRCSFALNQPNDAVDFVRLLNREFPDDPEVLYQTVHVYSDLPARASQELILKAPSSFQVHQLNAEALRRKATGKMQRKSIGRSWKRTRACPAFITGWERLILSAPKTETTLVDAKKEFEEELKIDPSNAAAEYVLGELAFQAADLNKAIAHFSRAVKLDVGFADSHLELGRALIAAERVPEAIGPLEVAVRLQPANPLTHFHLSAAYSRLGRNEEAKRERALHKELSEKMRQTRQDVQKAVSGVPPEELAK